MTPPLLRAAFPRVHGEEGAAGVLEAAREGERAFERWEQPDLTEDRHAQRRRQRAYDGEHALVVFVVEQEGAVSALARLLLRAAEIEVDGIAV